MTNSPVELAIELLADGRFLGALGALVVGVVVLVVLIGLWADANESSQPDRETGDEGQNGLPSVLDRTTPPGAPTVSEKQLVEMTVLKEVVARFEKNFETETKNNRMVLDGMEKRLKKLESVPASGTRTSLPTDKDQGALKIQSLKKEWDVFRFAIDQRIRTLETKTSALGEEEALSTEAKEKSTESPVSPLALGPELNDIKKDLIFLKKAIQTLAEEDVP